MTPKPFDLGDVLSITTGKMMSPRHMDGVYDILNFMTGDSLFTHQLPRAMTECAPYLLRQHPQLRNIQFEQIMPENFNHILNGLCAEYGEQLMVEPIPKHSHEFIDPISELAEKIHPNKIIAITPS